MMENTEMAVLAFNILNVLMICLAISIAGVGTYIWQTEIPEVSLWKEDLVQSQGLISGLLGGGVSVLAWLGTFGVNDEKPKLVTAYIVIFGALVIPTIALGVLTSVYMSKWMVARDEDIYRYMEKYYSDGYSANFTDGIQLGYRCCGMEPLPNSYGKGEKLPTSCCDPLLFRITQDTVYCEENYKFGRTCEGVLTGYLPKAVMWLSFLLILMAVFFVALLVVLHFVRHPLKKSSSDKNKDVPPVMSTVPDKDTPSKGKSSKETKSIPDKNINAPQKTV